MPGLSLGELVPVLQVAVGPVILVSGIGLLLLSMTNRLGRVVDRSRALSRDLRSSPPQTGPRLRAQLDILAGRARLLQQAIILATVSVLLAAVLVIVLFVTAILDLQAAWLIVGLFAGCMLSLIGSLVAFIHDLNRSLAALKLELSQDHWAGP
jgi:hypothetical protein